MVTVKVLPEGQGTVGGGGGGGGGDGGSKGGGGGRVGMGVGQRRGLDSVVAVMAGCFVDGMPRETGRSCSSSPTCRGDGLHAHEQGEAPSDGHGATSLYELCDKSKENEVTPSR